MLKLRTVFQEYTKTQLRKIIPLRNGSGDLTSKEKKKFQDKKKTVLKISSEYNN